MSFLDKILGQENTSESIWHPITTKDEVDEVVMNSHERPQIVLKHSRTCGTSYFAKQQLEEIPSEDIESSDLHIINVVRHRPASLYLADKFGIRHESPQLFVIKDGEVVWHGSHYNVNPENLLQALG